MRVNESIKSHLFMFIDLTTLYFLHWVMERSNMIFEK